ncbi:MAG: CopD family protein, partial [Mycetocola sp.]
MPQPFEDPGALVRWGLPASKLAFNMCAAVTIGAFVFAAFILPPSSASYARSQKVALVAAASWTIVSFAGLSFTFLSLVPMNPFDSRFLQQFGYFAEAIPLGQVWLITTLLAASLTLIAYVADRPVHAAIGSAVAVVALLPVALTGHGAGDQGHGAAVTALALHMVGAALWLGGLLVLVSVRTTRDRGSLRVIVQRYSALALSGFTVVTISGVISATIQLGNFGNLASPYGLIVLAKGAILALLGFAGAWNRSRLIIRLDTPGRAAKAFWLIVSAELLLLGFVSGLAAGLGRTPPPELAPPAVSPS